VQALQLLLSVLNIHPRMDIEGGAEKPNEIKPDEY
jgi:hypothetical protein